MIKLKRLAKGEFVINADHIEVVEETPDTVITLTNGKKFVVRESANQVIEKVIEYRQQIASAQNDTKKKN